MPIRTTWPGGPATAKDISRSSAAAAPTSRVRPLFMTTDAARSADRRGHCGAEILGAGIAAEIGGAGGALRQYLGDRPLDRRRGVDLAEMLEHHRARPDLADRVGD